MAKHSTTYGLTAKKISRLLALSREEQGDGGDLDADQEKRRMLDEFLSSVPALDRATLNALPTLLQQMCQTLPRLEGESFGSRLFGDHTQLEQLKEIKSLAKEQVNAGRDENQAEIAGMVYYAAIAAALVHHREKITEFSYADLRSVLIGFDAVTWLPTELANLYKRAAALCSEQCGH